MKIGFRSIIGLFVLVLTLVMCSSVMFAEEVVLDLSEVEFIEGDWELTDEGLVSKTLDGLALASIAFIQNPQDHVYVYEWTITFLDGDPEDFGGAGMGVLAEKDGYPSKRDNRLFPYYGSWFQPTRVLFQKGNYGNFWMSHSDDSAKAEMGETYTLKWEINNRRDGNQKLYVNGEEVMSWYEPNPHETVGQYITFITNRTSVLFSEVKVTKK